MKILQIKSSILGNNSVSSKYSNKLIERIKKENDSLAVRDVALNPVTQLSGAVLGQLADSSTEVAKEHGGLIDEIKSSDVIVIGAPMYNFSIPATLKNYFDAITKAGITFKYDESGQPRGLLENKKTYVVLSRGGKYKAHDLTFQEDYLKMHLQFIGLKDVTFIYIEGIAMGATEEELNSSFEEQVKTI